MDFVRNYSTLKEDPQMVLTLLNKFVKVEIIKDVTYSGYLIAVDPESNSIVLAVSHEGDIYKNALIPGHAVLNIEEDKIPVDARPFVIPCSIASYSEDVSERKAKLISWLKKNLLPVSEEDENIVIGNAYIMPPYSPLDICAENPIVVNQVRNMVSKMPDAYE